MKEWSEHKVKTFFEVYTLYRLLDWPYLWIFIYWIFLSGVSAWLGGTTPTKLPVVGGNIRHCFTVSVTCKCSSSGQGERFSGRSIYNLFSQLHMKNIQSNDVQKIKLKKSFQTSSFCWCDCGWRTSPLEKFTHVHKSSWKLTCFAACIGSLIVLISVCDLSKAVQSWIIYQYKNIFHAGRGLQSNELELLMRCQVF